MGIVEQGACLGHYYCCTRVSRTGNLQRWRLLNFANFSTHQPCWIFGDTIIDVAFVPIDCLSIPVSSFDSFLLKREFSGEFLCLGVCAPPALEYNIYRSAMKALRSTKWLFPLLSGEWPWWCGHWCVHCRSSRDHHQRRDGFTQGRKSGASAQYPVVGKCPPGAGAFYYIYYTPAQEERTHAQTQKLPREFSLQQKRIKRRNRNWKTINRHKCHVNNSIPEDSAWLISTEISEVE